MKADPSLPRGGTDSGDYARVGEQIRFAISSRARSSLRKAMRKIWRPTHVDSSFSVATYEGVDERVRLAFTRKKFPSGNYVLTGGELPALVLIDAAAVWFRRCWVDPESIAKSRSRILASNIRTLRDRRRFGDARARGVCFQTSRGIRLWRRKEALRITYLRRPDLLQDRALSLEDQHC